MYSLTDISPMPYLIGNTLMEVLLKGQLGSLVREGVARRLPISEGQAVKSWRDIMPLFIRVTMEITYPLLFFDQAFDQILRC